MKRITPPNEKSIHCRYNKISYFSTRLVVQFTALRRGFFFRCRFSNWQWEINSKTELFSNLFLVAVWSLDTSRSKMNAFLQLNSYRLWNNKQTSVFTITLNWINARTQFAIAITNLKRKQRKFEQKKKHELPNNLWLPSCDVNLFLVLIGWKCETSFNHSYLLI